MRPLGNRSLIIKSKASAAANILISFDISLFQFQTFRRSFSILSELEIKYTGFVSKIVTKNWQLKLQTQYIKNADK